MRRNLYFHVAFFIGSVSISTHAGAQKSCDDIDCDCTALDAKILVTTCQERERNLRAECAEADQIPLGFCTFGGKNATRTAGEWLPKQPVRPTSNAVRVLNLKWQSHLNSIQNRLKQLDDAKNKLPQLVVTQDLRQLQSSVDDLLAAQKKLAMQLEKEGAAVMASRSWHHFADTTTSVAKGLKAAKDTMTEDKQNASLVDEITNAEASMYEQSGYALSQAGHFADAAQLWKHAAEMASALMTNAEGRGAKDKADEYRYQRSTRLHRARELWRLAETP